MKKQKTKMSALVVFFICTILYSCNDKDNTTSGKDYDPSKPIQLQTFYPD